MSAVSMECALFGLFACMPSCNADGVNRNMLHNRQSGRTHPRDGPIRKHQRTLQRLVIGLTLLAASLAGYLL